MDPVLIIGASVVLGLFIGVFSGMLGIGGGTILVPAFRLIFGLSPLESTGTSLLTIIPTSLSGAFSHMRQKTIHVSLGLVLGLAGACMSPVGVLLASISPGWVVMSVAALVIGYSAVNMFLKALRMKPRKAKAAEKIARDASMEATEVAATIDSEDPSDPLLETVGEGSSDSRSIEGEGSSEVADVKVRMNLRTVLIGIAIGLSAGIISGYIGVGGGFIMIPLMMMVFNMPLKKASGTSLIAIIILAIPAVIQQGLLGNIDYLTGLMVTIGSIPGAFFGAKLAQRVPERSLRFVFGGFLIVAAVLLALNEFHVLG